MRASNRSRHIPRFRHSAGTCWDCRWACGGYVAYGSARNAHYCYTRLIKADATGIEADIDVLDKDGTVLLAVQGLRLGTGASGSGHDDQVFSERLLTVEWQQRELPEVEYAEAGSWLLIGAPDGPDAAHRQVEQHPERPRRTVHHDELARPSRRLTDLRTARQPFAGRSIHRRGWS